LLIEAWRIAPMPHLHLRAVLKWMAANGIISFVNQYTGLSVLDCMSSPLSHALANVMKRAVVITAAIIYAARPVSPLHMFGVGLSVFGAIIYQKFDEAKTTSRGSCEYQFLPQQSADVECGNVNCTAASR